LGKGFQVAFEKAWEAYKGDTVSVGEARRYWTTSDGPLKFQIAHAEINAILKLNEVTDQNIRDNIRTFTLYSC